MSEQPLTEATLLARIAQGEHTRQQFKRSFHNPDALAAELAAFANSGGGTLLIGVADDGIITENVQTHAGLVMVVTVPNGLAKPYLDQQGRIWVKQGADKRHVTAREELQRMFQRGGLVYADVVPVADTTSADLDEPAFRRYLAQHYSADTAQAGLPLDALLQNLGLGEWQQIELIDEVSGNQFTARVQRPQAQGEGTDERVTPQVTGQVTGQVAGQVEVLLLAMGERSWSRKALMEKLSLKGRDNFEKLYLAPALAQGLIERTIPDKPNSRLQQYRLTAQGKELLK
ncbi:AlbA family DNA-binding domain-containing protein [Acidithiobacillus concretivorus]|uniref:ATP-binding protein n=1 Tax=Acidithiobacillus concretivorus TaxID=3063952 RepID=A0ABS5ZL54_9PROT|nr:RNA-binding domain-containing protein [Acidithiobacillus concretivorus]MBU2737337.1 hypothetical protein [Acidithiobacillus concretivorus]